MVELKREINDLAALLGQPNRYDIDQLMDESLDPIAQSGMPPGSPSST
jgi:hypothetical protein